MDLNFIQMHVDNFVNTWKGWNDVFTGLAGIVDGGGLSSAAKGFEAGLTNAAEVLFSSTQK